MNLDTSIYLEELAKGTSKAQAARHLLELGITHWGAPPTEEQKMRFRAVTAQSFAAAEPMKRWPGRPPTYARSRVRVLDVRLTPTLLTAVERFQRDHGWDEPTHVTAGRLINHGRWVEARRAAQNESQTSVG